MHFATLYTLFFSFWSFSIPPFLEIFEHFVHYSSIPSIPSFHSIPGHFLTLCTPFSNTLHTFSNTLHTIHLFLPVLQRLAHFTPIPEYFPAHYSFLPSHSRTLCTLFIPSITFSNTFHSTLPSLIFPTLNTLFLPFLDVL